ncbi:MAG: hypothetical protein J2P57_05885 [Acidimicrobiaceae bacterium]|nr:hypothetical protein [Acidimicrobiaceae bacterium]
MCVSCGCGAPNDAHGDSRNITQAEVEAAAKAANISGGQAAENIREAMTGQSSK